MEVYQNGYMEQLIEELLENYQKYKYGVKLILIHTLSKLSVVFLLMKLNQEPIYMNIIQRLLWNSRKGIYLGIFNLMKMTAKSYFMPREKVVQLIYVWIVMWILLLLLFLYLNFKMDETIIH